MNQKAIRTFLISYRKLFSLKHMKSKSFFTEFNLSTRAIGLFCLIITLGCQSNSKDQLLAASESQIKLRSMQTRAFETTDKGKTLRTVIATMQDLGFVIDKADADLGTVSGTKLDGYALRLTATVRPRANNQLLVRVNAQYNITAVEDPQPYQQFFNALEKAMFLTAHQVD